MIVYDVQMQSFRDKPRLTVVHDIDGSDSWNY